MPSPSKFGFQQIHCIPPPSSGCEQDLLVLEFLGNVVSSPGMEKEILNLHQQYDERGHLYKYGVTSINADRYMISIPPDRQELKGSVNSSKAILCVFDGIIEAWQQEKDKVSSKKRTPDPSDGDSLYLDELSDVPDQAEIWDRITRYSITQAYTDLVYSRQIYVPYIFGTMCLIVSYGCSISQNPHVDMVHPNIQCSIVTQRGIFKATHEFIVEKEKEIHCSADLFDSDHGVQAWKKAIPGEAT
jgi:hypothetical protein